MKTTQLATVTCLLQAGEALLEEAGRLQGGGFQRESGLICGSTLTAATGAEVALLDTWRNWMRPEWDSVKTCLTALLGSPEELLVVAKPFESVISKQEFLMRLSFLASFRDGRFVSPSALDVLVAYAALKPEEEPRCLVATAALLKAREALSRGEAPAHHLDMVVREFLESSVEAPAPLALFLGRTQVTPSARQAA